jgi:8-oxo-dGTP diphosphatase
MPKSLPKVQRVAAYGLVLRDNRILLTRLARRISADERWHLPGGGVDHGEDPRDALVREIREETGLPAEVGETAQVYSAHRPSMWRQGRRWDYQALRIVYDAWVPADAPEPRVVEVDGSTVDVAWHPVADVVSGALPVTDIVTQALEGHRPFRLQRLAVYALIRREDPENKVLLTRISRLGAHPGAWTLPGGGLDHGESPRDAVAREVR